MADAYDRAAFAASGASGQTRDLSKTGMAIRTDLAFEVGMRVLLSVTTPNDGKLEILVDAYYRANAAVDVGAEGALRAAASADDRCDMTSAPATAWGRVTSRLPSE